tara:strand:+ start:286 stop:978 length:693 start_codon:yes stop_codon:yes gene_type:complete
MNEILENKSFFKNLKTTIEKNLRLLFISIFVIILIVISIQIYFFYENNKILKTSIEYNRAKSISSNNEYLESINNLTKEKNFYGILALLENTKFKLEKKDFKLAYNDYISLLENKKLSNLYKSAIAIHGSYSFLNELNLLNNEISLNQSEYQSLINQIENFLNYVDQSLNSYNSLRLEILFLLSIIKSEINSGLINDETEKLYFEINQNEYISNTIKDRIKKIYEVQKYK